MREDTVSPLVLSRTASRPRAAVLTLHGGRADGLGAPPRWNLPALRMVPFTRAITSATEGEGVVVGSVRYRRRGWNGSRADAARDALRALYDLADLVGDVPVVLMGHSMGGRAALRVAGHPLVRAVVGLAPWCPGGEPVTQLAARRVVLLHGNRDRVTDPLATHALAARAREAGAEAGALTVQGGDHAMLRRAGLWQALATASVTGLLGLGPLPEMVAGVLHV
ncbi:alpha/beta fold hydrolase [Streptomyces tsukubensis]|uniref:Alpha/beta hydrolase n=1 Tax=Streptomyces tsukubensis TaxID=83656 RepID=A0A1V4A758_9ACTN|nr:alpha/beta fold hydrolase [Streptomyces tsukubensis]OON78088.1 alpha/beta hydrolase [Streptomyces tsukubensis]QFR98209.1 alpha/beta fold hydrolase [Streptomyces tsukubensis]